MPTQEDFAGLQLVSSGYSMSPVLPGARLQVSGELIVEPGDESDELLLDADALHYVCGFRTEAAGGAGAPTDFLPHLRVRCDDVEMRASCFSTIGAALHVRGHRLSLFFHRDAGKLVPAHRDDLRVRVSFVSICAPESETPELRLLYTGAEYLPHDLPSTALLPALREIDAHAAAVARRRRPRKHYLQRAGELIGCGHRDFRVVGVLRTRGAYSLQSVKRFIRHESGSAPPRELSSESESGSDAE